MEEEYPEIEPEVLEPCTRNCLKCGKPFQSYDRKKNWQCKKCLGKSADIYIPRNSGSSTVYSDGKAHSVPETSE
jgi:ribosomal protein L37AE/L43A